MSDDYDGHLFFPGRAQRHHSGDHPVGADCVGDPDMTRPHKVATKINTRTAGLTDARGWAYSDDAVFAVTRNVPPGEKLPIGDSWRITHRLIGNGVNDLYFETRAEALRAAERFETLPGMKLRPGKTPSAAATKRAHKLIVSILAEQCP